jgi:hypothetical protein
MTANNPFRQQIAAYDSWKNELIDAIESFRQWMESQDLDGDSEFSLRVYEAIEALKKDRLNLAFVAEFSRGKTELINAIFFSDYKRRLLPSEAGRTTMCPTELFYDREKDSAYLMLLPIETRVEERSIQEYKEDPIQWTRMDLPVDDPDKMSEVLQEIIKTREVTITQADRLGLYSKDMYPHLGNADPDSETIDIPMWRHAMISFPHPLLQQGLTILDTPGLNALGSEPELTMSMLPAAQAILFLLAADTGVTRSDLDIWQHHINQVKRKNARGLAVILNKIDTLWDDLKSGAQIDNSIGEQIRKTATMLGVQKDSVFPISAQKGLLAKINGDEALFERSRLGELEAYIANEVIPSREAILRDSIATGLGSILQEQRDSLQFRLDDINKQLNDLHNLNGKNTQVITQLMKKTREEQTQYSKHVESYKSSHRLLTRQTLGLKNILNLRRMDQIIDETRKSMVDSWTTSGLKKSMKALFSDVQEMTTQASEETDTLHRLVTAIYKKFEQEHGLHTGRPKAFKVKRYLTELANLYVEAEEYRKSPVMTMSEQNFVIKRFFIQMVSQARNILFEANENLDNWLQDAMRPLLTKIQANKQSIEKRLTTLRKISESRESVEERTEQLQKEHAALKAQLDKLDEIHQRLNNPSVGDDISTDDQPEAAVRASV